MKYNGWIYKIAHKLGKNVKKLVETVFDHSRTVFRISLTTSETEKG